MHHHLSVTGAGGRGANGGGGNQRLGPNEKSSIDQLRREESGPDVPVTYLGRTTQNIERQRHRNI